MIEKNNDVKLNIKKSYINNYIIEKNATYLQLLSLLIMIIF